MTTLREKLNNTSLSKYLIGQRSDREQFLDYAERKTRGIKTGILGLDAQLRGLQGIVGILGGPKVCKSTLALQIALHNAAQDNPVIFIDRENGFDHMHQRMICNKHEMAWSDYEKLSRENKDAKLSIFEDLPFMLHTGAFAQEDLERWVEETIPHVANDHYLVLVLDSLHKLPLNFDNIRMSVDSWLLFLDTLKLKYRRKLVVITTIEKRRGSYSEATKDGGKESGRIEYTLEQQLDLRESEVGIALDCTYNRHGPAGYAAQLRPLYARANDKWSFMFKLEELEATRI